MKRGTLVATATAIALLALPGAAQARPWGGSGANDLGTSYALLQAANGQVRVSVAQMTLSCRDAGDGTYSEGVFDVVNRGPISLRRNRFSTRFGGESGGRQGSIRMDGELGSNGRGYVWLNAEAVGRDAWGRVVDRCQGRVRISLRRGAAR